MKADAPPLASMNQLLSHDEVVMTLSRYVGCKGLESLSSSQTSILHLSASRTRLALALLEATADSNSIPVKRYFFMLVYFYKVCIYGGIIGAKHLWQHATPHLD